MKKRYMMRTGLLLAFMLVGTFHLGISGIKVLAKTVPAKISAQTVKVGKQVKIKTNKKNVTFQSSNTNIASIDTKGIITGKKEGKVKVSITCKGYQKKSYLITVKKNPHKPSSLPVTFSEISMKDVQIKTGVQGKVVYSARIKNHASKGKIKKIIYHYEIQTKSDVPNVVSGSAVTGQQKSQIQNKKVTLTARNIAAGKTSPAIQCEGDYTGLLSHMKLAQIDLYTSDALYQYTAAKGTYSFMWGTPDTKAPQIKGLVKKNSYTGNHDVYRIYYSDKKSSYDFTKFVWAVDDRDNKVKVNADTSGINWEKNGIYKLQFTARDKAGNVAKSWAKVQVIIPGTAESIADEVLHSIIKSGWSDRKKARAIYQYVRKRFSYVNSAAHQNWRTAATQGIRYHSGDCYTYYAASRLLLTRAGIPNVMINRYPTTYGRHYWNLAYVSGGWYHFDTTPRQRGGTFCLLTDAQLWHYSSGYTFRFNQKLYPKRATKKISAIS